MAYNIQFKRATAARIAEVPDIVLLAGEPLLDTTNNQIYIGDGTTALNNLKPIQNTQSVLDDMVTKGLLTATTTTTTETHNYTTDILQLDNGNSPQGFMSAIDSTTAVCAVDDSAYGGNDFKINLKYPVTTGTLSSGDLESMVQVTTTNADWGSVSITYVNNGVETTFYKYIGDMTQTLTREGPFRYRINSNNNISVFIDPQTTLKSVAIINNYHCNNTAVIRMTNATYEVTESVTTYALNLPTATSSALGLVKPDNSTITVDANGTISANIPTATTSNKGLVQPDGTTITINNGVISAASSAPSNMVTTDTSQDISGTKTFRVTTSNYTPILRIAGYSSTGHNDFIVLNSNDYTDPSGVSIGYAFNQPVVRVFGGTSGAYSSFYCHGGIYRNGSDTFTFWKDYAKNSKMVLKNYQDIIMDSSMLDGTYLKWDSTTNKITVDIQAIKNAIDALSNSSGTASVGPDLNTGGWD